MGAEITKEKERRKSIKASREIIKVGTEQKNEIVETNTATDDNKTSESK